jgi:hypothetical protein
MNILEEIPNSKPSSSPSPMLSKPMSTGPSLHTPSSSDNVPSDASSSIALSDHFILFDARNLVIGLLVILIVLTYLGFNFLTIFGDAIQNGVDVLSPAITQVLTFMGVSTGSALNKAAEITSEVTTGGVEIAEGAVKNVGNLMIGDEAVGRSKYGAPADPVPDSPEDSIQKSLSSSKTKWCLVGEYQNKRGCIDISESDKCLSGQVFPNQEMCLNPALTKS